MGKRGKATLAIGLAFALGLAARGAHAQDMFPPLEWQEEPPAPPTKRAAVVPPAPEPYESPSAPFGARGQFFVTSGWGAGVSSTAYDNGQAARFSASITPGIDYFVVRNFSVGVDLELDYSNDKGYGADGSLVQTITTSFAAGPRLGFNIPLGRAFSLYTHATIGIDWARRTEQLLSGNSLSIASSPTGAPATTQTGPWISLYLPLLLHPAPHFFFGFGPTVFRNFGRIQGGPDVGAQRTRLGADFEIGGYFGGRTPAPEPAPVPGPRGPTRRFGDAGELVLTGEIGSSALRTTYDGTTSSLTSVTVSPGIDYFIVDQFSIGLAVGGTYSNESGLDGTTPVTFTTTGLSVAVPRIGVEARIARWLSFYPRADVYFGFATDNEQERTSANQDKQTYLGVGLYAPLLVHVAPHFFAGVGPSVSHDVMHQYQAPNGASNQVRGTTFGASAVVGAWL